MSLNVDQKIALEVIGINGSVAKGKEYLKRPIILSIVTPNYMA